MPGNTCIIPSKCSEMHVYILQYGDWQVGPNLIAIWRRRMVNWRVTVFNPFPYNTSRLPWENSEPERNSICVLVLSKGFQFLSDPKDIFKNIISSFLRMSFASNRVRSSVVSTAWIIESSTNDGGTEAAELSFLQDDSERWAAKYRVFGPVRRFDCIA